ncbi:hypothetical protein JFU47_27875 [Pseudomonas sp. TH39(2020)]|uniref:hypothetical protein n=1 Tax=Pseudomonas sp. TH39(2020) TaxID=2796349 RepID=UPI0019137B09|nr:hypothetical protein [Pseudomonas sp. TH39(2020)]MBK5400493.1 hypothetical protein [Pseudomonas sp. TH39(2020)]
MNYWPLICVMLASIAAVLGFGAGAATGATMNGVEFKDVFIPMFSALGGWVSGAGALAAVGTTIYFYNKQEEENEEDLEVTVYSRYGYMHVNVLCLSRHPAFVTDILFKIDGKSYWLSNSDTKQLNTHIAYKEMKTFDLFELQQETEKYDGIDLLHHADALLVETTFDFYEPDKNFVQPIS